MFKKRLTTCLTVLSALFLPGFAQDSETLDIRGVVVDTDDPPVPIVGATVFIQGSTTGTMTDEAGFFSINAKKGDIIIFSCIGYKDQEYRVVRSMANLSIALVEDVEVIDQAIVTGMTSQQRKHIASAVGAIDNKFSRVTNTMLEDQLPLTVRVKKGKILCLGCRISESDSGRLAYLKTDIIPWTEGSSGFLAYWDQTFFSLNPKYPYNEFYCSASVVDSIIPPDPVIPGEGEDWYPR